MIFLFTANSYSQDKKDEVKELKVQIKELQSQFNQMKSYYDRQINEMQTKIDELEEQGQAVTAQSPQTMTRKEAKALELPDISVIGNVVGRYGTDKDEEDLDRVVIDEAEIALQGYLYPGIRADVIAALHRHDGTYNAELEEGYVTFLETPIPNLSLKAGKKLLDIGKVNPAHPHHWNFVDRPAVLESYFGGHGLAGEGVNFSYLLPLPFFSQLDFGIWHVDSEHTHEGDILGFSDEAYSTRLWSSFDLTDNQELEIGLSGVKGHGSHVSHHKDNVKIAGADLTYRCIGDKQNRLLFQNEFYFLDRDVPVGNLHRYGLYSFLNYRFNKYWDAGVRYDYYESPYPDRTEKSYVSGILTRSLTESTKLRLQFRQEVDDIGDNDYAVFLQCIFGIGPHSHPLE